MSTSRHDIPQSSSMGKQQPRKQIQQQLSLPSASSIAAVEGGLRRTLVNLCLDQRTTLFTYFLSSEKQYFFRARLQKDEAKKRFELKLEEMEDVERTQRFDILFEAEVDWESLTGRLGAESFSLVTRRVVENVERTQFLLLAIELGKEREHAHRCEIVADGLRPGFIREQQKMIQDAWEQLFSGVVDECLQREDLVREGFYGDAPLLTSWSLQRGQVEALEEIRRQGEIEGPFARYMDVTRQIRDEFATFWAERVVQYRQHCCVDEEQVYQAVLLEEEFVSRRHVLIPDVVGGVESLWRSENVGRPQAVARSQLEVAEVLEREAVWRVAFPEQHEVESRERVELLCRHSQFAWGELYPQWCIERSEMVEEFANLMRCSLVSQRFALEFIAIGSRRGIVMNWSDAVFRSARNALVDREDIFRCEGEDFYFDLADVVSVEADELHQRHKRVMVNQIDLVYKIYQKAVIHQEATARQYIVDVEWENGIIFMYASFHRLWLETVTMGVTRNTLKREWERDTLVMFEVWMRLGVASRAAFALDSELLGQVREILPNFDEVAGPIDECDDDDDTSENPDEQEDESEAMHGVGRSPVTSILKKKKLRSRNTAEKDVNALPSVFYIGEDPFGESSNNNNNGEIPEKSYISSPTSHSSRRNNSSTTRTAAPPAFARIGADEQGHQPTPGIVVRFRAFASSSSSTKHNVAQGPSSDLPNLDSSFSTRLFSGRRAGGAGGAASHSKRILDSVFASPSLNAAAGSIWISPDSFDVVSIRASLRVFAKIRNHAFALLTQFFQIVQRKALEQQFDEWLSNYGDMGYWAHAIEVGLLEQLHQLDDGFVDSTNKTQDRALQRGSPTHLRGADEHLSRFVHEQDIRIEGKRSLQQHQQQQQKRRTVIDALRESLRRPPRPSQRKMRPVGLDMDPEMMCPPPKSSFAEWVPSRMTPDEFAHYEHNMALRSAGVEKQNEEATRNSRGVLPSSRGGDPGWSIYQRHPTTTTTMTAASRSGQLRHQQHFERPQSATAEASHQFDETKYDGRNSPGYRADALVKFRQDGEPSDDRFLHLSVKPASRPVSAQTIPRLAPSRQGDRGDRDDDESLLIAANEKQHQYFSNGRRHHERIHGSVPSRRKTFATDPQVESRKLQFQDIFDVNEKDNDDAVAASSTSGSYNANINNNNKNNNDRRKKNAACLSSPTNSISQIEVQTLSAYSKVLKRTETSQRNMTESTAEFLQQNMRPISLIVRPTPPPTPGPAGGAAGSSYHNRSPPSSATKSKTNGRSLKMNSASPPVR